MADLTVIGAGPVGSLLCVLLAQRGHTVECYERRPDLRRVDISAGRSINLAVSTRGLHALKAVGLEDEVLSKAVPMLGRFVHPAPGSKAANSFHAYGRDDSEFINSMARGELNKLLLSRAEATGRVRFTFEHRLVGVDLASGTARLRDERTGRERTIEAPVLLGTDGSASALRQGLAASAGVDVSQDVLSSGYKELTMPAVWEGGHGPSGTFALTPNALHIWPRGKFMLIALPNRDGSFTCTLFLAFEAQDEPSFAALRTPTQVLGFFQQYFPDAVPHIPDLAEQFLAAPLGQMVTVKAWPWSSGSALLLGDAAHAIVPFFGQGMNCGFEDCTALDALLAAEPDPQRIDWARLFQTFAQARKPNTDAIADLAQENFIEMRDKVADPVFLLHRAVEHEIQDRYPGRYLSRYQLVTFSRIPYRTALEAGRVQAQILSELCEGHTSKDQIDYSRALNLIDTRLTPLFTVVQI